MITIFAMPKAFRGHIDVIQRNAIMSWTRLSIKPEVILLGTDEGTAEVAREFGVCHLPEVARNPEGTPLVSDLFAQGQRCAANDLQQNDFRFDGEPCPAHDGIALNYV